MKLEKRYLNTRFTEHVIRKCIKKFDHLFGNFQDYHVNFRRLSVSKGNDEWSFENEDDFFIAYDECNSASFNRIAGGKNFRSESQFHLYCYDSTSTISVGAKLQDLEAG